MYKIFKAFLCLFLIYALGVSCSTDDSTKHPLNPNGDSELALLMRAMFDEAEQIKKQIANGDSITINLDHNKILTAHATEPKKAASAEYKAFAKTYLQAIKSLRQASPDQKLAVFNSMVDNCMSCHQALCPGPIVRIKKLK